MEAVAWDQRYAAHPTVYGEAPNEYFKSFLDSHQPGSLLLPAEGEGRNALYAAARGWQVDAFDYSQVARNKALAKAKALQLPIRYEVADLSAYRPEQQYDAVGLIYVHMPPLARTSFHQAIVDSLKPGGALVLEAFTPLQMQYQSGGPRSIDMLYTAEMLRKDFESLSISHCAESFVVLNEGLFHRGPASVVRLLATKPWSAIKRPA